MSVPGRFRRAVEKKDIPYVRISIVDSILIFYNVSEFKKYLEYAEQNMKPQELFQPHNGENLTHDTTLWNEDYMRKLGQDMFINFSKERLDHMLELCLYLMENKPKAGLASKQKRIGLVLVGVGLVVTIVAYLLANNQMSRIGIGMFLLGGALALTQRRY